MNREDALHADTGGNFTHHKSPVNPLAAARSDDLALKNLDTLLNFAVRRNVLDFLKNPNYVAGRWSVLKLI